MKPRSRTRSGTRSRKKKSKKPLRKKVASWLRGGRGNNSKESKSYPEPYQESYYTPKVTVNCYDGTCYDDHSEDSSYYLNQPVPLDVDDFSFDDDEVSTRTPVVQNNSCGRWFPKVQDDDSDYAEPKRRFGWNTKKRSSTRNKNRTNDVSDVFSAATEALTALTTEAVNVITETDNYFFGQDETQNGNGKGKRQRSSKKRKSKYAQPKVMNHRAAVKNGNNTKRKRMGNTLSDTISVLSEEAAMFFYGNDDDYDDDDEDFYDDDEDVTPKKHDAFKTRQGRNLKPSSTEYSKSRRDQPVKKSNRRSKKNEDFYDPTGTRSPYAMDDNYLYSNQDRMFRYNDDRAYHTDVEYNRLRQRRDLGYYPGTDYNRHKIYHDHDYYTDIGYNRFRMSDGRDYYTDAEYGQRPRRVRTPRGNSRRQVPRRYVEPPYAYPVQRINPQDIYAPTDLMSTITMDDNIVYCQDDGGYYDGMESRRKQRQRHHVPVERGHGKPMNKSRTITSRGSYVHHGGNDYDPKDAMSTKSGDDTTVSFNRKQMPSHYGDVESNLNTKKQKRRGMNSFKIRQVPSNKSFDDNAVKKSNDNGWTQQKSTNYFFSPTKAYSAMKTEAANIVSDTEYGAKTIKNFIQDIDDVLEEKTKELLVVEVGKNKQDKKKKKNGGWWNNNKKKKGLSLDEMLEEKTKEFLDVPGTEKTEWDENDNDYNDEEETMDSHFDDSLLSTPMWGSMTKEQQQQQQGGISDRELDRAFGTPSFVSFPSSSKGKSKRNNNRSISKKKKNKIYCNNGAIITTPKLAPPPDHPSYSRKNDRRNMDVRNDTIMNTIPNDFLVDDDRIMMDISVGPSITGRSLVSHPFDETTCGGGDRHHHKKKMTVACTQTDDEDYAMLDDVNKSRHEDTTNKIKARRQREKPQVQIFSARAGNAWTQGANDNDDDDDDDIHVLSSSGKARTTSTQTQQRRNPSNTNNKKKQQQRVVSDVEDSNDNDEEEIEFVYDTDYSDGFTITTTTTTTTTTKTVKKEFNNPNNNNISKTTTTSTSRGKQVVEPQEQQKRQQEQEQEQEQEQQQDLPKTIEHNVIAKKTLNMKNEKKDQIVKDPDQTNLQSNTKGSSSSHNTNTATATKMVPIIKVIRLEDNHSKPVQGIPKQEQPQQKQDYDDDDEDPDPLCRPIQRSNMIIINTNDSTSMTNNKKNNTTSMTNNNNNNNSIIPIRTSTTKKFANKNKTVNPTVDPIILMKPSTTTATTQQNKHNNNNCSIDDTKTTNTTITTDCDDIWDDCSDGLSSIASTATNTTNDDSSYCGRSVSVLHYASGKVELVDPTLMPVV